MVVRWIIKRERKVRGRLGKMLQIDGGEIKVLEMFYMEVVQEMLLIGLDYWLLLEAMEKTVEGAHKVLLLQIKGKHVWRNADGTWVSTAVGGMQESAGMHSENT